MLTQLKYFLLFLFFIIPTAHIYAQSTPSIQFTVDKFGLTSLVVDGVTYAEDSLARGISGHHLGYITFSDGKSLYQDQTSMKLRSVDTDGKGMTLIYPWGTLGVRYIVEGNALRMRHTLTNSATSTASISAFSILTMRNMRLPITNQVSFDTNNLASIESGAIGSVVSGSDKIVISFSDMAKASRLNFVKWYDSYGLTTQVSSGKDSILSIPPGGQYTFDISYYFGKSNQSNEIIAPDAYKKFTDLFPFTLQWNDNRPIIRDFISEGTKRSATNPRGYLKEPALDVSTQAGKDRLRTQMLKGADSNIKLMKDIGSQGIIIWDLEGQEFDHVFTYVGAPDSLPELAPEMNEIADELFKKYTDAGFRVGVTIRPQKFGIGTTPPTSCTHAPYPATPIFIDTDAPFGQRKLACGTNGTWYVAGGSWQQVFDEDDALIEEMSRKIQYAKNRWGATLFYIDSNAYNGKGPYTGRVFEELNRRYPGVLLIPELENTRYFRSTAPYNQTNMGFSHVPSWAAPYYPQAKTTIYMGNLSDTQYQSVFANFVNGVRNKNLILMIDWCCSAKDPQRVKDIIAAASTNIVYTMPNNPTSAPAPTPVSTPAPSVPTQSTNISSAQNQASEVTPSPTPSPTPSGPLTLMLRGDNPAYLPKGSVYMDLGVQVTGGSSDFIFKVMAQVNNKDAVPLERFSLDTSSVGTTTITYTVIDSKGNTGQVAREVVIGDTQPVINRPSVTFAPFITPISRTLSIGLKGDDVLVLQRFLFSKGYLVGQDALTGYFGSLTREAVKKIQCEYGVVCEGTEGTTGYGMVGNKTKAVINPLLVNPTSSVSTTSVSTIENMKIQSLREQISALLKIVAELQIQLQKITR